MNYSSFTSQEQAFQHSKKHILDLFYQYDDFMESIGRVIDLGCDTEAFNMLWFANATTRDGQELSLNIKCVGQSDIDKLLTKHNSISFQKGAPEMLSKTKKKFDILYCHDTLQFIVDPYQALRNWWNIANKDAMLVIAVKQTTNVEFNMLEYNALMNYKHHYTVPILLYMLAVNGWDCKGGFFKKAIDDPWIYALVYRSNVEPMNPQTTNLYNLIEDTELLPDVVAKSIEKYGMIRQKDLVLPWLDSSNMDMRQQ
tara:strand:+ start:1066 stop:1830 length:765 start_codon:yes stop_codon:yes gene_type:complete